ncbi:MAG: hypothetical protein QM817_22840 [Archangium sp.]
MTPSPNPMPAPQQPKPQQQNSGCSRGCLIAVLAAGGLMLLVVVVSGIFLWRAASSEEGQKVMKAIGKGASLAAKGLNAPGAAEIRDLGCPEAFVLDMQDMRELIGIFDTDGGDPLSNIGPNTMVMCQGYGTLPTCDEIAAVYTPVKDRPRGEFVVLVQGKTSKVQQCSKRYADDGSSLGDFATGSKKKNQK